MERSGRGFTLLELILVVLLLALLSVYAANQWSQDNAVLGSQADRLADTVRRIQTLAMTRGQRLTLNIAASNDRYYVRDAANNIIVNPVSGAPYTVLIEGNTSLTGADTQFDGLGRPVSGGALLVAPVNYVLSTATRSSTVSVAPISGFVTVTP